MYDEPRPHVALLCSEGKKLRQVQMLKEGLEKLQQVLELHGYDVLNLPSCTTLDVENMHNDPLCTLLDYARNFGKCSQRGPQENVPLGSLLFYKSQVMVSCA